MKILCLFLDFKSALERNKTVHLSWRTLSENDCYCFDLERSTDGENWDVLERIPTVGGYNQNTYYQTKDKKPLDGNSYYRLKVIGTDGSVDYSVIKMMYIGLRAAM